jgi:hypothetical protein
VAGWCEHGNEALDSVIGGGIKHRLTLKAWYFLTSSASEEEMLNGVSYNILNLKNGVSALRFVDIYCESFQC